MEFTDSGDVPFGGDGDDRQSSTRELVLVVLEQLSISFDKLSRLEEASPLLERLMVIACTHPGPKTKFR